jgi:hypothetical protein
MFFASTVTKLQANKSIGFENVRASSPVGHRRFRGTYYSHHTCCFIPAHLLLRISLNSEQSGSTFLRNVYQTTWRHITVYCSFYDHQCLQIHPIGRKGEQNTLYCVVPIQSDVSVESIVFISGSKGKPCK